MTITLTVQAGDCDRLDSPVSAALPKSAMKAGGQFRLVEVGRRWPVAVPCQTATGTPARLCWILSGKTPAGITRTYELTEGTAAPARTVQARKGPKYLDVTAAGRKVLRYWHASLAPPKGVDPVFTRSAFIHPVWSPGGQVLTDNFPADHYHHKGVWMPWTRTKFRGRETDFWNLRLRQGTVRFAGYDAVVNGPVFGGFDARQEHVAFGPRGGEKIALRETWQVRVWNVAAGKGTVGIWDLTSTQACAGKDALEQVKYRYGGMGFRGRPEWNDADAYYLTDQGKTRKDGHGSRARWCAVGGRAGRTWAGAAMLSHPKNFRHPEPVRMWPEGEIFLCWSPSQLGPWKIEPGKPRTWRYRLCTYDGQCPAPARLNQLWHDFAHPPATSAKCRC